MDRDTGVHGTSDWIYVYAPGEFTNPPRTTKKLKINKKIKSNRKRRSSLHYKLLLDKPTEPSFPRNLPTLISQIWMDFEFCFVSFAMS